MTRDDNQARGFRCSLFLTLIEYELELLMDLELRYGRHAARELERELVLLEAAAAFLALALAGYEALQDRLSPREGRRPTWGGDRAAWGRAIARGANYALTPPL